MLYTRNKNYTLNECNVNDLHKYFYITELVMTGNTECEFTNYDIILYNEHSEVVRKKQIKAELISQLKVIDTTKLFTTNYRIFNNESSNCIFFKAFFVSVAIKCAEIKSISLIDAINFIHINNFLDHISCRIQLYLLLCNEYMQAENSDDVAESIAFLL